MLTPHLPTGSMASAKTATPTICPSSAFPALASKLYPLSSRQRQRLQAQLVVFSFPLTLDPSSAGLPCPVSSTSKIHLRCMWLSPLCHRLHSSRCQSLVCRTPCDRRPPCLHTAAPGSNQFLVQMMSFLAQNPLTLCCGSEYCRDLGRGLQDPALAPLLTPPCFLSILCAPQGLCTCDFLFPELGPAQMSPSPGSLPDRFFAKLHIPLYPWSQSRLVYLLTVSLL